MDKFIFTFKCLVLFFGFVGYFKYYEYLANKCLNEFNYSLYKPGIVTVRLTLTLISFNIILLGSTLKENLIWIVLPLIVLFIKDLKNTNLQIAIKLLFMNIIGAPILLIIFVFEVALKIFSNKLDDLGRNI